MKHIETPLRIHPTEPCVILGSNGMVLADVRPSKTAIGAMRAKDMVEAVNNHDVLKTALADLLRDVEEVSESGEPPSLKVMEAAYNSLKKLEE